MGPTRAAIRGRVTRPGPPPQTEPPRGLPGASVPPRRESPDKDCRMSPPGAAARPVVHSPLRPDSGYGYGAGRLFRPREGAMKRVALAAAAFLGAAALAAAQDPDKPQKLDGAYAVKSC